MIGADKPVFPHPDGWQPAGEPPGLGMTYRQWLEGMALQGLLAAIGPDDVTDPHELASDAKRFADALIAKQQERGT